MSASKDLTHLFQEPNKDRIAEITDETLERAEELAEIRHDGDDDPNLTVDPDASTNHYLGAIGELVFCDWYDTEIDDRQLDDGDDGVDAIIDCTDDDDTDLDQIDVGIKTTKYPNGDLLVSKDLLDRDMNRDDKTIPDMWVLVRPKSWNTEYEWEIAGWISNKELVDEENVEPQRSRGTGMNYAINRDARLHPVCRVPRGDIDVSDD